MPIHQNKLQIKATWAGPNITQKNGSGYCFGIGNFSAQIWFFLNLSVLQKQLKKKMLNENHIL